MTGSLGLDYSVGWSYTARLEPFLKCSYGVGLVVAHVGWVTFSPCLVVDWSAVVLCNVVGHCSEVLMGWLVVSGVSLRVVGRVRERS